MKASWLWLSELVDLSGVGGPEKLGEILTSRGLEVEAIERLDKGLEKVVTVQILERNPHPQADRLSLCRVTLGAGDPLEIVCGAQNMKAGDKVALAQIGAELPNGLKIALSKIRGVTSNGMLCSEEELKFKAKSEGILILPPATPLGRPLAEVLGRDDTIFTFKLTANRGDCLSHFGLAREIAAALGQTAKRPEIAKLTWGTTPIAIGLDAGESVPQFVGVAIDGVKVGPSPAWVGRRLEALGSRSINNVVDASNLAMLELGHPTHAYDAARLEGGKIFVRQGQAGEEVPLLDGTTAKLAGSELVIADGRKAVGLAGVMGGGNSEVSDTTTRVFLESAEFAPGLVRRAATRHQHRTEASHRFERGDDPQGAAIAAARVAKLLTEWAGGKVTAAAHVTVASREPAGSPRAGAPREARKITVRPSWFGEFLGMSVTDADAERIMSGLECRVTKGVAWTVEPPSYRLDLSIPEDLAEEVARTLGYDQIGSTVPPLTSMPQSVSALESMAKLTTLDRAKDALRRAGLAEVLNYSFTSKAWLAKFGLETTAPIVNPLSEECEALVPSLLPGLVATALSNWNHHFGSEALPIRLFELRPTFAASGAVAAQGEMATNVSETWRLGLVLSGPRFAGGMRAELGQVDFFDLKAIFDGLFETLGTRGVRAIPFSESRNADSPLGRLFHPGQSVEILAGKDSAGFFGQLHPGKARELKLRDPLWAAELDWGLLSKLSRAAADSRPFKGWSEFPAMERDFALLVGDSVTADKITRVALKAGAPLAKGAKIFDVYRGSQVAQGMTSIAVRVIFYEEGRSLQESEAETASAKILEAWKIELSAELRG